MRLHILILWFAGIQPILDAAVDPTNIVDRTLLLPFSSHWAQVSSSASRFTAVSQVRANLHFVVAHYKPTQFAS